ncbi:MAG: hypothetical protein ABW168_28100 [Sedimenticola sp.]
MSKLADSVILLALGTAILFCSGTAYYHGYVTTLDLETQIIERGFHQTLYQGLMLTILPAIYLSLVAFPLFYFYSHGLLQLYVDLLEGKYSRKKKLIKIKKIWLGKKKDRQIQINAKKQTTHVLIISIAVLSFIFSMFLLEKKGRNEAKEVMALTSAGKAAKQKTITARIDGQKIDLQLLICGARNCAGLKMNDKNIYYFTHTSFSHKQQERM